MNLRFLALSGSVLAASLVVPACGGDDASSSSSGGTFSDGGCPSPATQKPAASCDVTLETYPIPSRNHVPEGTPMTYCSNPPSGGDHYPVWANFQEYTAEVPWPYLVHSMEHGAVLLLYKCDASSDAGADGGAGAGCPDVVEALRRVRDAAAADPLCDPGVKRIVIAPSSTLRTKVAAAAWGHTYQAPCVDEPTLSAFVRDNYGKGPEEICAPGRTF